MARQSNRWICDLIFCAACRAHVPVFHDLAPGEQALVEAWEAQRPRRQSAA